MLVHIGFGSIVVSKNFGQLLVNILSTQTTGDDVSLRVEKECVGDGTEMVGLGGDFLCVDDLRIRYGVFFYGGLGVGRFVGYCDAEDLEATVMVQVVGSDNSRDFFQARSKSTRTYCPCPT